MVQTRGKGSRWNIEHSMLLMADKFAIEAAHVNQNPPRIEEHRNSLLAIILCVSAAEAYANHLLSDKLPEHVFRGSEGSGRRGLVSLSISEKWRSVLPWLVSDREWHNEELLKKLDSLIELRNRIVHYKARYVLAEDSLKRELTAERAREAVTALASLIEEFHTFTKTEIKGPEFGKFFARLRKKHTLPVKRFRNGSP